MKQNVQQQFQHITKANTTNYHSTTQNNTQTSTHTHHIKWKHYVDMHITHTINSHNNNNNNSLNHITQYKLNNKQPNNNTTQHIYRDPHTHCSTYVHNIIIIGVIIIIYNHNTQCPNTTQHITKTRHHINTQQFQTTTLTTQHTCQQLMNQTHHNSIHIATTYNDI